MVEGDEFFGGGGGLVGEKLDKERFELIETEAGVGGDGQVIGVGHGGEIGFIGEDGGERDTEGEELLAIVGDGVGGVVLVGDQEDDIGLLEHVLAGLVHFLREFIGGGFDTGDIDEADDLAIGESEGSGEDIAGGAGDGGDDGAVLTGEGIDEGTFADIGTAGKDDGGGLVETFPACAVLEEGIDALVELGELGLDLFGGDKGDCGFIGEIDSRFDEGEKLGEGFGGLRDPVLQSPGTQLASGAELAIGGGGDGGRDTFGLREIEFAVEEGLGGEFAGASETRGSEVWDIGVGGGKRLEDEAE